MNNFTGVSGMDLAGDSFVVRVGVVRVGVALGEGVNLGGEARGVVGLGVLVLLILPRYNSSVLWFYSSNVLKFFSFFSSLVL